MKIYITNKQQDLPVDKPLIKKIIKALATLHQVAFDELSLHFVTDSKMKQLHKQLFNDPSSTDCITCPIDPPNSTPYCLLGEVFICPYIAKEYALAHRQDALQELVLYVIHGFLHLLGYDDISPEDEKIMRAKEQEACCYLQREGVC